MLELQSLILQLKMNKELYYYDKRGKLIRWIDTDGTVHDKENDSTEYTKRGEKYWKNALEQLDE